MKNNEIKSIMKDILKLRLEDQKTNVHTSSNFDSGEKYLTVDIPISDRLYNYFMNPAKVNQH